jgi:hypothetical protein
MPRLLILALIAALADVTGCRRPPAPVNEVVAVVSNALPADPLDVAWQTAPEHVAALLPQDLVEPRLLTPSTPEVRVRARAAGREIAIRLEWVDAGVDDRPGPGRFSDAAAVQVPMRAAPSPPDPQMGQEGHGVFITYWRADWQATVNGRGHSIQQLYPGATVDHYPFEAPPLEPGSAVAREMARLYAPAIGAGNERGLTRTSAVEDLVAEGPGTLSPAPAPVSRGVGVRTKGGWAVVITRPLPDGLSPRSRTQIAFAVWNGGAGEVGARKMRTGWVPLSMREVP